MKETKFKQTEVGLIPSDWEVYELGQLYNITSSKRVFQKDWTTAGIPFYRAREIAVMSTGKTPEEDLFITKEMFESYTKQYGRIKENDVLITGVGTLGKVYVVKQHDEFYFKDGNIIWLQWKGKNSSSLLKQFYETEIVINQIFGNSGGSTVATYTIANAKKTKLPLPPTIEEQKRIAQALSDVDAVISTTEKLIAKKKALKQGAMQTLLSGKMRIQNGKWIKTTHFKQTELGPIPQEWNFIQFGQKATIVRGGSPRPIQNYLTNRTDGINWIKIGDVKPGDKYITTTEEKIIPEGKSRSREVHSGDFILSNSMSFGRPYILKLDGCIHDGWLAIQNYQETFDTDYLYYLLGSDDVFKQYIAMAAGSSVQNLNKEKVSKLQVPLPSKTEQTAIATILSDMDSEIAALETKLAKYRTLKTGMMQQLLTGKIRLV